jgi:hypothetical protein
MELQCGSWLRAYLPDDVSMIYFDSGDNNYVGRSAEGDNTNLRMESAKTATLQL